METGLLSASDEHLEENFPGKRGLLPFSVPSASRAHGARSLCRELAPLPCSVSVGAGAAAGSWASRGVHGHPHQLLAWEQSQGELAGRNQHVLQPVPLGWHQGPRGAACKPAQLKQPWHGLWGTKVAWSHLCSSPASPSAVPRSGGCQGAGMEAATGQEPAGKREMF